MVNHGALVGWTHHDIRDGRVIMFLKTRQVSNDPGNVDTTTVLMTKSQAMVLGNYLFEISGGTPPDPRKRSWFRRILG